MRAISVSSGISFSRFIRRAYQKWMTNLWSKNKTLKRSHLLRVTFITCLRTIRIALKKYTFANNTYCDEYLQI